MYERADDTDMAEGMLAYERYHMVMRRLVIRFEGMCSLAEVCAVFCSLSPNSDYYGNLRSTVSVLQGLAEQRDDTEIVVSTYSHCKARALAYARGVRSFEAETKGLKILNFYHNILTPHSSRWVTIDGHMAAIYRDTPKATMKESLIKPSEYLRIAQDVKAFAFQNFMLPQQMQAILWFTRKRSLNIAYDPQLDLFADPGDAWQTFRDVSQIKSYTKRDKKLIAERLSIIEHQQELGLQL
jgi:hypothetical protein